MTAYFGFINAFKPPGPTSAAFGNWVRRCSKGSAVGHWGTLDPLACGVLVLGIGTASRLFPLVSNSRKSYVFELVVGEQTDSGDSSGSIVARSHVPKNWKERLPEAASALIGPGIQVPPMHSAVKVSGRPLYRSARSGRNVARAARPVTIYELKMLAATPEPNRARLFVECAAGTYVRVLCETLGNSLGLPAHMGALLRVASGPFVLAGSVTPSQLEKSFATCLIDPLDVLTNKRVELDVDERRRFLHGDAINRAETFLQNENVLVTHNGKLLGIGYVLVRGGAAILGPKRVLESL